MGVNDSRIKLINTRSSSEEIKDRTLPRGTVNANACAKGDFNKEIKTKPIKRPDPLKKLLFKNTLTDKMKQ